MTVTGFAAFGSEAEVVDFTALAVLAGDARLALTLAGADVTQSVGGTQSMAVTPLAALPAVQVVEPGFAGSTVPAADVRQAVALAGHGAAAALLPRGPVGVAIAGFAFVCRVGSQRVSEEAILAAVAVEAGRVVDALQAFSRQAVAVSDCVGVDVGVALAQPAEPRGAVRPLRVSEVAIVAELASLAGGPSRTVGAHHLLGCRDYGTA